MTLLAASGLRRRYAGVVAVDGLSFTVEAGEMVGFLGPNGAGKSTTFEMLSGLRAPDAGEFRYKGRPIAPTSPELREKLGVVFQKPALDDKLTARENLFFGGALYGVPRAKLSARIETALRETQLEARADEPVARFSGGMRRRLELARVLLHEPELLVLDEPTQGLDPGFRRAFWKQLREQITARGLGVLLTTHDPEEAEQCDRLAVMDAGKIVAEGTPRDLRNRVGGDVITLEADDPEELVKTIAEKLALPASVEEDHVVLAPRPDAHELVPRLVEALPKGRLRSLSVRRPSLADVFVKLTGKKL